MLVRMKTQIGGYRNGVEWPAAGTVVEIVDHEGADLIAAGLAEEAPEDATAEFVAPDSFADPAGGAVYQPAQATPDGPVAETEPNKGPADATKRGKPARAPRRVTAKTPKK